MQELDLKETRTAEKSLIRFIQDAWHVLEPASSFVPGWHLDAIAQHLEAVTNGGIRNLLINMPPRHCKSLSVCVFWPVWEWIRFPQRRWLFSAYAAALALRDSARCRRLILSPWFQDRWEDRFELLKDQNSKSRFENDQGGCRLATGVCGAATGEGGDRVIVDDPHRISQRESRAVRESTLIWWDQTMSTRLNNPRTGARVIIMQRLHEQDLSGHVLQQGGYVHLFLPAEFESDRRCTTILDPRKTWSDPRMTNGELLWPERLGSKELDEAKLRLGAAGYSGQFQQRPAPADGAMFKQEYFRYYRRVDGRKPRYELLKPDGSFTQVEVEKCQRFATMDPAAAEKLPGNSPCYTVIQIWDVTPEYDLVLVDQYRKQVEIPSAVRAAVALVAQYDAEYILVERDGVGRGVVASLKEKSLTVKSVKARGEKTEHAETAVIRMENGQIYFLLESPILFDLHKELLLFPHGQYTDQVDALAYAANHVQQKAKSREEKKEAPPKRVRAETDDDDADGYRVL